MIAVNWLSGYRKMVVTAVETIFGLLERGFDWGIWDVSFLGSGGSLGSARIFARDSRDTWRLFNSGRSLGFSRILVYYDQQDTCDTRDTWRILTPEDLGDLRGS